jgi:pimeloyl-ACP methyl ester carboxylesterase
MRHILRFGGKLRGGHASQENAVTSSGFRGQGMSDKEIIKYVVVLVHGTFAPNSAWTQPGSKLCRILSEQLGADAVHLESFNWPGFWGKFNNSHSARLKAGERLRVHLKKLQEQYRGAKIFVIGHSHGGNVAFYALRDDNLRESIGGVVTFSTPFIDCSERNIDGTDEVAVVSIGFVLLFCLAASFIRYAISSMQAGHGFPVLIGWGALFMLVLLGAWFIKAVRNTESQSPRRKERAKKIVAELSLPSLPPDKVFCAAGAWDEAAAGLYVFQTVATLPHRLWNGRGFVVLYGISVLVTAYCLNLPQWQPMLPTEPSSSVFERVGYTIPFALEFGILTWFFLVAVLALIVALLPILVRSHLLGFGWERPALNILTNIGIRKSPPGINRWIGYVIQAKGLAHSRLYDDEEVIKDVASWISTTSGI